MTIPDAPDYEINSNLIIRQKSTGRIIKSKKCRMNRWEKVPSLQNRFELSIKGELRNVKTKRRLKLINHNRFCGYVVGIDGRNVNVTLRSLMFEIHGVEYYAHNAPIECYATKDGVGKKFETLAALAKFLAGKSGAKIESVSRYLRRKPRPQSYRGWKLSYAPRNEWTPEKQKIANAHLRKVGKTC